VKGTNLLHSLWETPLLILRTATGWAGAGVLWLLRGALPSGTHPIPRAEAVHAVAVETVCQRVAGGGRVRCEAAALMQGCLGAGPIDGPLDSLRQRHYRILPRPIGQPGCGADDIVTGGKTGGLATAGLMNMGPHDVTQSLHFLHFQHTQTSTRIPRLTFHASRESHAYRCRQLKWQLQEPAHARRFSGVARAGHVMRVLGSTAPSTSDGTARIASTITTTRLISKSTLK
jgi:hypothetical protein